MILNRVRATLFQNRFMESTLRALTKGKPATHWICRLVPNHYQYGENALRQLNDQDTQLELDLSDWMEWHLYYGFSDPSQENLLRLCRPNDVVIDVGANIGATMVQTCQRVGNSGMVIGFEPDPKSFRKCQEHLSLNRCEHALVLPLGVGSEASKKVLRVRVPSNQGMNQISPEGLETDGVSIQVTTLDSFVREKALKRLDVIKIDVEGYENEVLKGAQACLETFHPRLFIEIDDLNLKEHGSSPEEIYRRLESLGYRLYENNLNTPLRRGTGHCHFDLVAIIPNHS